MMSAKDNEGDWIRIGAHRGDFDPREQYEPGDITNARVGNLWSQWQRQVSGHWAMIAIETRPDRFSAFSAPGRTDPESTAAPPEPSGAQSVWRDSDVYTEDAADWVENLGKTIEGTVTRAFAVDLAALRTEADLLAAIEPPLIASNDEPARLAGVGRWIAISILRERQRRGE